MNSTQLPQCKNLVLDAGPLLSLSPLRGLAETYYTVPQVLAELKDRRAREHFERLGLTSGVKVEIKSPDAASLATGALLGEIAFYIMLIRGRSHPMGEEDRRLCCSVAPGFMCTGLNLFPARTIRQAIQ